MSLKPGDLIRDTEDGMLGLVVTEAISIGQHGVEYVEVLWEGQSEPRKVDLAVVKNRWIEAVDESR